MLIISSFLIPAIVGEHDLGLLFVAASLAHVFSGFGRFGRIQ
jgi:hypothetical protein